MTTTTTDKRHAERVCVAKRFEAYHARENGGAKPVLFEVVEDFPGHFNVRSERRSSLGTLRYTDEQLDLAVMSGVVGWITLRDGDPVGAMVSFEEAMNEVCEAPEFNLMPCFD
jgi:hypothetical protein